MKITPTLLVLAAMSAPAPWVLAHGPGDGRGPPRPPPEAYTACEGAADGDTCSVELREHVVTGRCRPDREQALYCHPDRPPPRRPPPEAYAACEGAAEGDACTVQPPHGGTVEGTCARREASEPLHCRPSQPPPPPPGHE